MVASTRNTGSLPMSPLPKSVSSPQIATRICRGTPNRASIRDSSAAWRCSIARPLLMRPGPTRVETYCSNDLLKVPRWRRSKLNTAISWLTPPSAALVTPGEIPAADASADMLCTKQWKSPPQRAAKDGVVRRVRAARMDAEERTKPTLVMTNHFLPEGRPLKAAACSLIPGLPQQEGLLQPSPMEARLHA